MTKSSKDGDAPASKQATSNAPVAGETVTSAAKRTKAPSPRRCRDFIRRETANAMPTIVNTFVGKAKEGSVPHFTSLAKVGGFDQLPSASELPKRRGKSLGRQLLDEVEKYEAKQAAELAAANEAAPQIATSRVNGRPQERL